MTCHSCFLCGLFFVPSRRLERLDTPKECRLSADYVCASACIKACPPLYPSYPGKKD